jgi:hypothetical protein
MRSIASSCRARLWLEVLAERCLLSTYGLGHTVRVSHGDPFASCTADLQNQQGTLYPSTELETFLTVDPNNPDHLAAIWQQDRWSSGGARGLEVGISFDGGQTWQDTPLPGLTPCTGGTSARTSDPWIAFAVNGDLYATSLGVTAQGAPGAGVEVSKSTDGGLTWLSPVLIPGSAGADKESITTDPSDPNLAYAVWTGQYSRTTDGGRTWAPARSLPTGGGSQIVVLPDGTLVDSDACEVWRSTDHGQSWGPRITVPNCTYSQVIDPNTRQPLRAGLGLGDIAVDPNSGALYIVIEDNTFSGRQHDSIALTQSRDGGLTWSRPVQANQTPTNIPQLDQQAYIPTVQVAADGTVGVAYYDFRFNQGGSTLPTDYWFVPGTPDGAGGITWGKELRLTHKSFDFEAAPFSVYGKFVGDYQGRAAVGNDMLNLFGHPHGRHGDGIFFRRVINLGDGAAAADAGDLDATTQDLGAVLRVDPAAASAPVILAGDQPAEQSLTVALPVAPDLLGNRWEPTATQLMPNAPELSHAAPAHSLDVTLPALLVNEGIQDILES